MIIIAAPGQGSQTPGFLEPWIAEPSARDRLVELSDHAGIDLLAHGTTSDADTIRDTRVAQPLIVAAGILTLEALGSTFDRAVGFAGHSVGELTAAVGAGVLSANEAMQLVAVRSEAMATAAAETPTGMAAVLGGDESVLLPLFAEHNVAPANYNGGGQIVVAGPVAGIESLIEAAPKGVRVIRLQTAGAFHTSFMSAAVAPLRAAVSTVSPSDPKAPLWTNNDGTLIRSGSEYLDLIVGQVESPVRWDLCMEAFADANVTGIIELAPAGALVGLAKRGLRGVPSVAIKTPEDLSSALELLQEAA
ncbi:ACP S-malonyltransferase [Humidisolicoccus flavus]|uniref:ACP S-malonyltransferase n=1 Tax=Humidisolicoccus flavus TaxID=3111414 RepID=UPI0032457357